jgi:hypothetical protein
MTTEKIESSPGAVLLGELKELVESFPAHRRKEMIGLVTRVFNALNRGLESFPENGSDFGREESA